MFPPPLPVKLGKKLTIYLCVSVRLHGVIVQNMTNIAIILISHFKNFEYKCFGLYSLRCCIHKLLQKDLSGNKNCFATKNNLIQPLTVLIAITKLVT